MNVVPMKRSKKFFWSYSRLKNYERCPRRYYELQVAYNFKDVASENLEWGNEVHEALARRLRGNREPLPITMHRFEDEALKIEGQFQAFEGLQLRTELKLAIDNQFRPTGWYDNATWFRAAADVLILAPPVAIAYDWKTGKILEDIPQLALMAQTIFSNYPNINTVGTRYVWLDDPVVYTDRSYDRSDMTGVWNDLWPRLQLLMQAHETMHFPPNSTCGLCRRFCIVDTCQFNGRNE